MQRSIYERFVQRLVEATERLCIGHPFDARTQVSSLVHADHLRSVERYVAMGREDGGEILTGGARPGGAELEAGAYYAPTIIAGLGNTARICREEIFGPVLVVLPFDDEADVIAQANDNDYGLGLRDLVAGLSEVPCVSEGPFVRALSGSTPTSSFRSRHRLAAMGPAGSGAKRDERACAPISGRNPITPI